jgi:hypothetical protein
LGEHRLCKPGVAGSIPVRSTKTEMSSGAAVTDFEAEAPVRVFGCVANGHAADPVFDN